MKNLIGITALCTFLFASCASEVLIFDNCEIDEVSYLTIENNTAHASMDLYLDGYYLVTLPPQGQHYLDNVKPGKHEIEGRESNGFRIWIRDLTIEDICQDIYVQLGQ